jgi:site-specific recombinase XerD
MDTDLTAPVVAADLSGLIPIVENAVTSPNTKRAYRRALAAFFRWYHEAPVVGFSRATVQAYRAHLEAAAQSPASINVELSAIRKLASEAEAMGLLDSLTAGGILRLPGVRKLGSHAGRWLTRRQAEELMALPDVKKLRGLRDRAVLGLLMGCGLRRDEVAKLRVETLQDRDGRPVLVDITGKGGRLRVAPVPVWSYRDLRAWLDAAQIAEGLMIRKLKAGQVAGEMGVSAMTIYNTVIKYSRRLGVDVRPHDLRRTFAKLARRGSATLESIQGALGHSQLGTTQIYLGHDVDYADSACDHLQIEV